MWFCAFRLLTEISNPFMNIRILLDMMDVKKNSYIARLNGKFFLSSFVLTRPPMIPAFWGATIYHLFKNSEQLWQFDLPSLFFWVVSGLALDYLNVIWLIKIRKGEHLKSVPVYVQFGRSYSRYISDITYPKSYKRASGFKSTELNSASSSFHIWVAPNESVEKRSRASLGKLPYGHHHYFRIGRVFKRRLKIEIAVFIKNQIFCRILRDAYCM